MSTPTPYAASCNPPRRAKRANAASPVDRDGPSAPQPPPKPEQRLAQRPPSILPKQPQAATKDYHLPPSPESDSVSDGEEEDEYAPGRDAVPPPKRRGRKPGVLSRSARESLRKLNHSKIEKARRTKINETLGTLSALVNDRPRVLSGEAGAGQAEREWEDADGKGKKGKAKAEEKEFKLDVLVKTVEYMQALIARVKELEGSASRKNRTVDQHATQRACAAVAAAAAASAPAPPPPKRKRNDHSVEADRVPRHKRPHHQDEEDSYGGDDEHGLGNGAESELPSPLPFAPKSASKSPGAPSTSSPRLPPIASWLPHPYVDPSSLMPSAPSGSSSGPPPRSPTNAQLPSPPSSGRFRSTAALANMPALTLPGPAHPLAASRQKAGAQRKSVSASPSVSPTWTPEDETAASLLLHMSAKPSTVSSSARSPRTVSGTGGVPLSPHEMAFRKESFGAVAVGVETPGSLLGMRD